MNDVITSYPRVQNLQSDWKEDWRKIKTHLMNLYPITDNNLDGEAIKAEVLFSKLEKKLDVSREYLIDSIWEEWSAEVEAHYADRA